MSISAEHRKQKTNAMKAYRKQWQYIYHHCQLSRVTPSHTLIVGVCLLMLPMLELATEHVQLATMYCRNPINHVHTRHMTFNHTNLVPFLSNVLPAMVLQNRVVKYQMSVIYLIPLQCLSCIPQPCSHLSGEEGGSGVASTATDEWRHRDEPRTCW